MSSTDLIYPPVISPFRTIKNLTKFVRNPIPVLNEYLKLSGDTFGIYLGFRNQAVVTTNPRLIQYILQKNHRNYQKSPLQVNQLAHFIGRGLLTSEGEYWLRQRRLIQPGFHRAKLAALSQIVLSEIDIYLDLLDAKIQVGGSIDIAQEMMEETFTIVAKALFSTDIEKSVMHQLSEKFNSIQGFVARLIRQPFLKRWHQFSGVYRKHEIISRELQEIVFNIIQQRKMSAERPGDLLDMLIESRYADTEEGMTDQQLLEESLILLVAGHETSANALAWTWYLLSQHPVAVEKIRAEIRTVLGEQKPTFDSLPQLVYLSGVLQEAMRLYPPAWILDRVPIEDDEFEGLALPKGRIIGIYTYGVHHDPTFWPDPEKFDPSRFDQEEVKKRPAFTYLPFGGGPRLCIGSNFAMMEMQMLLIRMIQRFDFEIEQDHTVEIAPLITLRPQDGIRIRFKAFL